MLLLLRFFRLVLLHLQLGGRVELFLYWPCLSVITYTFPLLASDKCN